MLNAPTTLALETRTRRSRHRQSTLGALGQLAAFHSGLHKEVIL
jgi:hypothetical protein